MSGEEHGAALIEFALVVSVLLILVFGVVQFGIAYHVQQGLQAGAREGARLAALPDTGIEQVKDSVRDAVSGIDSAPGNESCPPTAVGSYCITVTPSTPQPCGIGQADTVRVEIAHRMRIDLPVLSQDIVLTGTGVYRCER